jgi:hypothetical protein
MTDTTARPTCFLITGLPRSGTSSVAQLLENLGVHFGDSSHFLDTQVHKHNPVFYELQWINDFNDRVIAAMGAGYFEDFFPVERDFDTDAVGSLEPELIEQFRGEFGERSLVGIKDPRLCFTLPLWRRVLVEHLGYDVKLLLTLRNPAAVIRSNSLLRDDSPCRWQRFYARHLLAINYFARDGTKMCRIDFDRLMADPQATATDAANCIGLPIPDAAAATRHLSAQHYHHRPDASGTGDAWVDQVDRDLRQGTLEPQRYLLFRDIALLYAGDGKTIAAIERRDAERRIAELAADKDAHISKLESAYRKVSDETVRGYELLTASKDQHIVKLEAMVRETAGRIQAAEQAIFVHEAEVTKLREELVQSQNALGHAQTALAAAQGTIERGDQELQARQSRIESLTAGIDALRAQLTEAEGRAGALSQQLSDLRGRRMVRLMHLMDRVGPRRRHEQANQNSE